MHRDVVFKKVVPQVFLSMAKIASCIPNDVIFSAFVASKLNENHSKKDFFQPTLIYNIHVISNLNGVVVRYADC
jgi:hypothetical protein